MGNFVKDLRDAKVVEADVAIILAEGFDVNSLGEGATVETMTGKFNGWDFVVTRPPLRYELKNDKMAKDTGNVAVEYECRGKPSGINVTKADIILYKLDGCGKNGTDILVEIRTEDLIGAIANSSYRKVVGGDYGSKTKMHLIPLADFLHIGDVIHTWKDKIYGKQAEVLIIDDVAGSSPSIDVV